MSRWLLLKPRHAARRRNSFAAPSLGRIVANNTTEEGMETRVSTKESLLQMTAVLAVAGTALGSMQPAPAADDLVARGEYLAHIMDCTGCHTTGALAGQPVCARCVS